MRVSRNFLRNLEGRAKPRNFAKFGGCSYGPYVTAPRIVFSFTPNSAASERVFSLLKLMFGETQMLTLADYIQAALMLRYNGRKVG